MKAFGKISVLLIISVLCVGSTLPLRAEVIYDNSANDLVGRFNTGTVEVGDEVMLAGTSRFLTYFSFEFWGTNTASATSFAGDVEARVKLYMNDGTLDANNHVRPGSVLYDSGWFGKTVGPFFGPTERSTFVFTAGSDFPSGGLWIPGNILTWSVQFQGMEDTDSLGVDIYCPPLIGNNYNDYWENDPVNGWTLLENLTAPQGQMNFGALMEAVPEPSTMVLSLVGGLGMLVLTRRLRRKE